VITANSRAVGSYQATGIQLLDLHELAGGKLAALMARLQARDLFDARQILQMDGLDNEQLRIAFVVYGAMNRKDWRTISIEEVDFDTAELTRQLVPTLRLGAIEEVGGSGDYRRGLVQECRQALSAVLPFTDRELEFLDLLLDKGQIDSTILTADAMLQNRIQRQPLLEWKALNVRQHKGLF
jgi:hypothetical protein